MQGVDTNKSQIVEFYKGRCVLVTGASGFLGKVIIEKLLRTCTGIRKIFVLIRPKKNKSAEERLDDLLESAIFDHLKELHKQDGSRGSFEQLRSKLVVLEGNLEESNLGQNNAIVRQLADDVSVIIHSAAIVSFLGKLKLSVDINLCGTYNLLELACKLPKICAFIYVSTCYSNCTRKTISEHIYPIDIEPKTLIELAKTMDEDELEKMRAKLIGSHPNNYTYTKQLAEYLCGQYMIGVQQLPVLICRPSIIVPTCDEPIKGFVDNRNAGNGFFDGISRGIIRVFEGKHDTINDLIPADYVANCVISQAWFANLYHEVRLELDSSRGGHPRDKMELDSIHGDRLKQKMIEYYLAQEDALKSRASQVGLAEQLAQVPVVHVSTGSDNPITCDQMARLLNEHILEHPSLALFRKPGVSRVENRFIHKLIVMAEVFFVGTIMDYLLEPPELQVFSSVRKRIRSTWSEQFKRCYILTAVINYFIENTFEFDSKSLRTIIDDLMNKADKEMFNCDVCRLDWYSYSRDTILGIRHHLIGDPEESLPEARLKIKRTLRRNNLLQVIFVVPACYLLYILFCWY